MYRDRPLPEPHSLTLSFAKTFQTPQTPQAPVSAAATENLNAAAFPDP